MIQTRHWKRHLKVGVCVAGVVSVALTAFALVPPQTGMPFWSINFLALPAKALVELVPPVEKLVDLLPESIVLCNIVLFCAATWGVIGAIISGILSFLFPREIKPTPPR